MREHTYVLHVPTVPVSCDAVNIHVVADGLRLPKLCLWVATSWRERVDGWAAALGDRSRHALDVVLDHVACKDAVVLDEVYPPICVLTCVINIARVSMKIGCRTLHREDTAGFRKFCRMNGEPRNPAVSSSSQK